jgi:hypothetical protein
MARDQDQDHGIRERLLELLLDRLRETTYPSATQLDLIEASLTPETVEEYAETLMEKISADTYPSIQLIRRVQALA